MIDEDPKDGEHIEKWLKEAEARGIVLKKVNNMKYTDKWFKFPVRIYDGFSVHKAILIEDKKLSDNPEEVERPEEVDWVQGFARIPLYEIASWIDYYSEGRETSDVANEGFDLTMVETKTLGKYECVWKRQKFEEELNKFYDETKDLV